jgi:hypothetical protein
MLFAVQSLRNGFLMNVPERQKHSNTPVCDILLVHELEALGQKL